MESSKANLKRIRWFSGENQFYVDKEDETTIAKEYNEQEAFSFKSFFGVVPKIFKKKYICITPWIWLIIFSLNLVYNGVIFTLPLTVAQINYPGNKGFYELALSDAGELIAIIPSAIIIEIAFFGRKRSLAGSFLLGGAFLIGSYFTTG